MMPFSLFFDPTMLLLIPAFIITIYAQYKVNSTYKKYAKVQNKSGITGASFAEQMLRKNAVSGIQITSIEGNLTDHFDPMKRIVALSRDVYSKPSVASVAIAAHECGHVLQKERKYAPMSMRNAIVPLVNVCSNLAFPMILIGMFIPNISILITIGAWVYFAVVVFQLITLPVEFNASSRALANIKDMGVFTTEEQAEAKKVLTAAALTYVAGMLSAFLSFLRLMLIANRRSN